MALDDYFRLFKNSSNKENYKRLCRILGQNI